jgi:hypothetical protein
MGRGQILIKVTRAAQAPAAAPRPPTDRACPAHSQEQPWPIRRSPNEKHPVIAVARSKLDAFHQPLVDAFNAGAEKTMRR